MTANQDAPSGAAYSLSNSEKRMARTLLEGGVLSAADLRRALEFAATENVSFQASLFKLSLVRPEALAKLIRADAHAQPTPAPTPPPEAAPAPVAPAAPADSVPTGAIQLAPHDQEGTRRKRLGELLVDARVITEEQLAEAVRFASEKNILLGTALVTLEFVTEPVLAEHMARHSADVKKAASKGKRLRLGDILVEQKTITADQLKTALDYSKTHKRRLGEALVDMGLVKDRDIAMALSKQMALPYVNLAKSPPDVTLFQKIPKRMCLKNQLLPFRLEGKVLTVAIVDPLNVLALDDIQNITGFTVLPVIVTRTDFDTAAKNYLGEEEELLTFFEAGSTEASGQFETGFSEDATPIVNLINKVIGLAASKGASDIHIDPQEKELRIRFRIDGVLTDMMNPPAEAAAAIVSRIKVMSNLDIAENRLPQDGKFRMKVESKVIDFRVAILPVVWGEKVVIRLLDQSRSQVSMDDLGLEKKALDDLRWGIHQPNGIVLVTGPTGSGKSTTLYSALHELQDPKVNIHTAEDPVEFSVHGITQVAVKPDIGLTFSSVLRSFLRQDPDIILLGEIRDLDSASIAFKAAMTGHLVLSTLHTNDAIGTIDRLITMGIDRFIIASAMKVILAQRLVRRLCKECRQEAEVPRSKLLEAGLTPILAEQAGLDFNAPSFKILQPVGCQQCNEGYKGRVGIHEVLPFSEAFREHIIAGASNFELLTAALEGGMLTLRESALLKALRGVTSIDEVNRLTASSQPPSKQQRGAYKLEDAEAQSSAPPASGGAPLGNLVDQLERLARVTNAIDVSRPLTMAAGVAAEVARSLGSETSQASRDKAKLLEIYMENLRAFVDSSAPSADRVDVNALVRDQIVTAGDRLADRARLLSGNSVDLKKVAFSTALEDNLPAGQADRERLRSCLEQVVVNSMCFLQPGGKLALSTKRVQDDAGRDFVEVTVLDNGPGLQDGLGDVTQPGVTGIRSGLGLGLAIVQRYVSQMKGRVEIKSKPGKGCLVKFRVPVMADGSAKR